MLSRLAVFTIVSLNIVFESFFCSSKAITMTIDDQTRRRRSTVLGNVVKWNKIFSCWIITRLDEFHLDLGANSAFRKFKGSNSNRAGSNSPRARNRFHLDQVYVRYVHCRLNFFRSSSYYVCFSLKTHCVVLVKRLFIYTTPSARMERGLRLDGMLHQSPHLHARRLALRAIFPG